MIHFDIIFMFSPFGNYNDEHNDMQIEYSYPDQEISIHDMQQQIPEPVIPLPPSCRTRASSPFNMIDFMHKASSYKSDQVFRDLDAMPCIPVHIPCERPGGEARRVILKV
jgi:hypothetical protein